MNYLVSASVLSADMLNLESEIRKMEKSGIDMLHFDVMDGVFVNNITYGLAILEAVDKGTDMLLDVHLMIIDPLKYVERFAQCGADIITFHLESESDTMETIKAIKKCGVRASLSIKPNTPAEEVFPYLPYGTGHDCRAGIRRTELHNRYSQQGEGYQRQDQRTRT